MSCAPGVGGNSHHCFVAEPMKTIGRSKEQSLPAAAEIMHSNWRTNLPVYLHPQGLPQVCKAHTEASDPKYKCKKF